jgi:hypothetical protein
MRPKPDLSRLAGEAVGRGDQLMHDAGLGHGVASVGDDAQARFRPRAGKVVGGLDRRHHVVAAMHDHAGNRAQTVRILDQLIVGVEEAAIDEIVALDARKGERVVVLREATHAVGDKVFPSHALQARAASSCTAGSGWVRRR